MRANTRPGTMSYAVDAPPLDWSDCDWNVVQRNAPGAISAIAFTVRPVRLASVSSPGPECSPSRLLHPPLPSGRLPVSNRVSGWWRLCRGATHPHPHVTVGAMGPPRHRLHHP